MTIQNFEKAINELMDFKLEAMIRSSGTKSLMASSFLQAYKLQLNGLIRTYNALNGCADKKALSKCKNKLTRLQERYIACKSLIHPQMNLDDRISIAKEVCSMVAELVTTTEDHIPWHQHPNTVKTTKPHFTAEEVETLKSEHGEEKVNQLLNYIDKLIKERNAIRKKSTQVQKQTGRFPITACNLSVANSGVGQCQEVATLAFITLLKRGVHDVSTVMLSDNIHSSPMTSPLHFFVLLGNTGRLKSGSKVSTFEDLPDDCVVLDPLLKYVGFAQASPLIQQAYLSTNDYRVVRVIQTLKDRAAFTINEG